MSETPTPRMGAVTCNLRFGPMIQQIVDEGVRLERDLADMTAERDDLARRLAVTEHGAENAVRMLTERASKAEDIITYWVEQHGIETEKRGEIESCLQEAEGERDALKSSNEATGAELHHRDTMYRELQQDYAALKAEVERLMIERNSFYMDYRMKFDAETKKQAYEIERLRKALYHQALLQMGGYGGGASRLVEQWLNEAASLDAARGKPNGQA